MMIIETCPKCGHDLTDMMIMVDPPIPVKECYNCGWRWEGQRGEIVRILFAEDVVETITEEPQPCVGCSNNIKIGGSGICHCTLNQKVIY